MAASPPATPNYNWPLGNLDDNDFVNIGDVVDALLGADASLHAEAVARTASTMALSVKDPQFGAKGDGTRDDTAAINAAASALNGLGGGILFYPRGTYKCTGQLTYYPNQVWLGEGRHASTISLTTELYSSGVTPANFIYPNGGVDFGNTSSLTLEKLHIHGPGIRSLGQATSRTNGIFANSKCLLRDVFVEQFYAGVAIRGDHQAIESSTISNNYYGVDFVDGATTFGSQPFRDVDLTGNTLASIHIGGSNDWDAGIATQVHLGFGPVGIFKTDIQDGWDGSGNPTYNGGASTKGGLTDVQILGMFCEAVGNAAILDVSTGGWPTFGAGSHWRSVGHSWSNTYKSTASLVAGYQQTWAVVGIIGATIEAGEHPFIAGSLGVFNLGNNSSGQYIVWPGGIVSNLFGSGSSWSAGNQGNFRVDQIGGGHGTGDVVAYLYPASGTINAGDLVEFKGSTFYNVQRATGTSLLAGVALTPAGNGNPVLVQVRGSATLNCIGTGPIGSGQILSCNSGTPYLADLLSSNPGMPSVGVTATAGANPTTSLGAVLLNFGPPASAPGLSVALAIVFGA